MSVVAPTFPTVSRSELGYDVDEVDRFLEDARRAYAGNDDSTIGSVSIRATAFSMRKAGYSPAHVDAALERLEDVFATREREQELDALGKKAWYSQARTKASEVVARLERPERQRFERLSFFGIGYHPADVDTFAERLLGYFKDGKTLSIADVRTVVFRPKRGGYREAQVDAVLDTVIEVMLAVR